jgi:hypothetical protein
MVLPINYSYPAGVRAMTMSGLRRPIGLSCCIAAIAFEHRNTPWDGGRGSRSQQDPLSGSPTACYRFAATITVVLCTSFSMGTHMPRLSERKPSFAICKQVLLLALVCDLSVSQSISAPLNQSALPASSTQSAPFVLSVACASGTHHKACETRYQQCLEDIGAAYTRKKMACESDYRRCLKHHC